MRRRGEASEGRFGEAEPEGCASIREIGEGRRGFLPQRAQRKRCGMNIDMTITDLVVESSYVEYVEDGKGLNVLVSTKVSPDDKPGDPEPRWIVIADPATREITRVDFAIATDEGFEYPEYTPTDEQMALFRKFAKECE